MKYLSDIIDGLAFTELQGSADIEIAAVVFDSRKVIPGSLFVAVKGTVTDGHDYILQAVADGAVAVICEVATPPTISDSVIAAPAAFVEWCAGNRFPIIPRMVRFGLW